MAAESQLHAMDLEGFWMDVGQPKDYLTGTGLYLSSLGDVKSSALSTHESVVGNVIIHPTAKIGSGCKIGPNVVIGANVVVGDGVRIQKAVIMENARIKSYAWINSAIVGWDSTVGKWTRLEGVSVLGDDVQVGDELYVNGGTVLPHKSISTNISEPKIVM
jgi:mannose-1-phosphate guanylyltransferase